MIDLIELDLHGDHTLIILTEIDHGYHAHMEIDLIKIDLHEYDLMELFSASSISVSLTLSSFCVKRCRTKDDQKEVTKKK